MGVSNRKLTVTVDGTSVELQNAVKAAVSSLKELGGVLAEQSKLAVDWGEQVVKSNDMVASSFGRSAEAAKASIGTINAATKTQITAQGKLATAAKTTSDDVAAAAEKQASAMRTATGVFDDTSKAQVDALDSVATAAQRTSSEVVLAADRQAAAIKAASGESIAASERTAAGTTAAAEKQQAGFAATGSGLVRLGKTAALTAAAVAGGSLYMSAHFESSTNRILTQAGATQKQLGEFRKEILDMAGPLGQTPENLSKGLYHIVSSMNKVLPVTTRTKEELQIMAVAAHGAAVGNTSMEETTYALASAMNALHQNAGDAEHTMALLNAIVGSGDMTMGDLLAALKSGLIPTAKTFGVSLHSVGAALAVMGDQGMRGALAGTRLRMALSLIAAPSEKSAKVLTALGMGAGEVHARTTAMSEALEAAGLTTTTMAEDLRKPNGIVVALSDLRDHLKKSGLSATEIADVFGRAFGGGRMSASIELLSQSVGRVGNSYDQIQRQTNDFRRDTTKTQETLAFQAKQAGAAIEALGIKIGHDLTPAAKTVLHDLEETAKWFEHNKAAAEALAFTITAVLGVAITAFLANKAAKMVEGLKQISAASSWLRGGFGSAAVGNAATAEAGTASNSATSGILGGMGIGGARSGPGLPGSMTNPIIVAIESGQFAGLGGEAAAGTAVAGSESEVKSAASEVASGEGDTTAAVRAEGQGMLFAPGVGRAAEQESMRLFPEPAPGSYTELGRAPGKYSPSEIFSAANPGYVPPAEKDLGGSARKLAGGLLDNLMKAGMVAGIGVLGAQTLGAATHSQTVAKVGTDAALGAAIGTAIEPGIGTAIGGGLGLIAGALKSLAPNPAGDRSHALFTGKGTPNLTASKQAKAAEAAFRKEEDELAKLQGTPTGRYDPRTGRPERSGLTAAEAHRKREVENYYQQQAGSALGGAESEYVEKGKKNPGIESIINTSRADLAKLKPIGRAAFIEMITEMVKTLEHEGRLVPGSLKKLVEQLKPQLHNLPQLAASSGKEFTNEFLANLNRNSMQSKLSETAKGLNENWAREFGMLPVTTHQTIGEVESNTNHDLGVLEHIMKTGTAQQREEAEKEYKQLKPALQKFMGAAGDAVENELTAVAHHTGPLSMEAVNKIREAWNTLPKALKEKLDDAGGAVSAGIKKINEITNQELHAIGVMTKVAVNQTGNSKAQEAKGQLHATGGMVQIGRKGQAGRDTVPMIAGGVPIIGAPGEKVAVITRHQEQFLNQRTADVGGLGGVFQKYKKPNYMAEGGAVSGTFSKPQLEGIWSRDNPGNGNPHLMAAIALAESAGKANSVGIATSGGHAEGLWQIMMPVNQGYVHGNVFNPDVNARAAGAILRSQGLGAWETYTNGSYRQFLGAKGGAGASYSSMTPAKITAHALGSGVLQMIAQGSLNKVTSATNKSLAQLAASAGAEGGATGGGGGGAGNYASGPLPGGVSVPGAAWNPLHKPIDNWIIPILNWAHTHGWGGTVTSGYRTYAEQLSINKAGEFSAAAGKSNHEFPNYPGGAVDVTDPSELISAMSHYAGHPKLIGGVLGPVDPEHFSATGRAKGGWVYAASGISPKPATIKIPKPPAATKAKITKPASKKTKLKATGKSTLGKKLGPLKYIPGLEELPAAIAPFNKELEAYGNLSTLLGQLESNRLDPVVLPGDLAYLPGLAGAGVRAGMPLVEAYEKYESATASQGQTNSLQLEGEYIKWAEQQADHKLLTGGQAGILKAAAQAVGLSGGLHAGQPIMQVQQAIKEAEVGLLGGGTGGGPHAEGPGGGELGAVRRVSSALAGALSERKAREKRLKHLEHVQEKRREHLKKDNERLSSASLHQKLHAALDAEYQSERVQDAEEHKAAISETLAGLPTKNRTKADETLSAHLKEENAHLSAYLTGIRNPVQGKSEAAQRAEIAILKNRITDELRPIDESLTVLKGSSGMVSVKGVLTEEKAIEKAREEAEGEAASLTGTKIPIAQLDLQEIIEGLQESAIPKAIPSTTPENTALTAALEARLLEMSTEKAAETAQFHILENFELNVPHFEKGGPVLEDGLAYVHKGEHVVPRDGTLVAGGGQTQPTIEMHQQHVYQGELGALMQLVDSRIQHPTNIRVISRMQQQRVQNFPGFARAGR